MFRNLSVTLARYNKFSFQFGFSLSAWKIHLNFYIYKTANIYTLYLMFPFKHKYKIIHKFIENENLAYCIRT